MKTTTLPIVSFLALAARAVAQDISSFQDIISTLPACGQTCLQNILAKASDYGCTSTQVTCLCNRTNFKYAIRDCARSTCNSNNDSDSVVTTANNLCAAVIAASQAGSTLAVVTSAASSVIGFSISSSNEPAVIPTTYTSDGLTYTTRLTTNRAPTGTVVETVVPVASLTTFTSGGSSVIATLVPSTSLTTVVTNSNTMVSTIVATMTEPLALSTVLETTILTEASTTVTNVVTNVQTVIASTHPAMAMGTHIPIGLAGFAVVVAAIIL